jgi:hypothetical protein
MDPDAASRLGALVAQFGFPGMFEAMARKELRADPGLLG